MPRDHWQKAADRSHARKAASEYASTGSYISYESVYDDLNSRSDEPRSDAKPVHRPPLPVAPPLVAWLNSVRKKGRRSQTPPPVFTRVPLPGEPAAIPLLVYATRQCRLCDQDFVVEAASRIGQAAAFAVADLLQSRSEAARRNAAALLARLGPLVPPIVAKLNDAATASEPSRRDAARRALRELEGAGIAGASTAIFDTPDEIDRVVALAASDDGRASRRRQEWLLGQGRKCVEGLERALNGEDLGLRRGVLRMLAGNRRLAAAAVPSLRRIATSPDDVLYREAVSVLQMISRHSPPRR